MLIRSLPLFPTLLTAALSIFAQGPTQEQLTAAARVYFRDSTELPMDVAVTTVVRNSAGKTTKTSQTTVRFLFKGYNLQTHRFSFSGNSGIFSTGALRDSFSGNFAVFLAAGVIADLPKPPQVEISSSSVRVKEGACEAITLMDRYPIPKRPCFSADYKLSEEADSEPRVDHFKLEFGSLPARAKAPYLGDVEIRGYRVDGEFQKVTLPGDPKPYLLPGKTVTLITCDKGTLEFTNVYSPRLSQK